MDLISIIEAIKAIQNATGAEARLQSYIDSYKEDISNFEELMKSFKESYKKGTLGKEEVKDFEELYTRMKNVVAFLNAASEEIKSIINIIK